jgi:hypothetical protein
MTGAPPAGDDLRALDEGGTMASTSRKHRARVGDLIVIEGHHVGDTRRTGEILEVLGDAEHEHYRVRWEDHESLFYPASGDATVKRRTEARR